MNSTPDSGVRLSTLKAASSLEEAVLEDACEAHCSLHTARLSEAEASTQRALFFKQTEKEKKTQEQPL